MGLILELIFEVVMSLFKEYLISRISNGKRFILQLEPNQHENSNSIEYVI